MSGKGKAPQKGIKRQRDDTANISNKSDSNKAGSKDDAHERSAKRTKSTPAAGQGSTVSARPVQQSKARTPAKPAASSRGGRSATAASSRPHSDIQSLGFASPGRGAARDAARDAATNPPGEWRGTARSGYVPDPARAARLAATRNRDRGSGRGRGSAISGSRTPSSSVKSASATPAPSGKEAFQKLLESKGTPTGPNAYAGLGKRKKEPTTEAELASAKRRATLQALAEKTRAKRDPYRAERQARKESSSQSSSPEDSEGEAAKKTATQRPAPKPSKPVDKKPASAPSKPVGKKTSSETSKTVTQKLASQTSKPASKSADSAPAPTSKPSRQGRNAAGKPDGDDSSSSSSDEDDEKKSKPEDSKAGKDNDSFSSSDDDDDDKKSEQLDGDDSSSSSSDEDDHKKSEDPDDDSSSSSSEEDDENKSKPDDTKASKGGPSSSCREEDDEKKVKEPDGDNDDDDDEKRSKPENSNASKDGKSSPSSSDGDDKKSSSSGDSEASQDDDKGKSKNGENGKTAKDDDADLVPPKQTEGQPYIAKPTRNQTGVLIDRDSSPSDPSPSSGDDQDDQPLKDEPNGDDGNDKGDAEDSESSNSKKRKVDDDSMDDRATKTLKLSQTADAKPSLVPKPQTPALRQPTQVAKQRTQTPETLTPTKKRVSFAEDPVSERRTNCMKAIPLEGLDKDEQIRRLREHCEVLNAALEYEAPSVDRPVDANRLNRRCESLEKAIYAYVEMLAKKGVSMKQAKDLTDEAKDLRDRAYPDFFVEGPSNKCLALVAALLGVHIREMMTFESKAWPEVLRSAHRTSELIRQELDDSAKAGIQDGPTAHANWIWFLNWRHYPFQNVHANDEKMKDTVTLAIASFKSDFLTLFDMKDTCIDPSQSLGKVFGLALKIALMYRRDWQYLEPFSPVPGELFKIDANKELWFSKYPTYKIHAVIEATVIPGLCSREVAPLDINSGREDSAVLTRMPRRICHARVILRAALAVSGLNKEREAMLRKSTWQPSKQLTS